LEGKCSQWMNFPFRPYPGDSSRERTFAKAAQAIAALIHRRIATKFNNRWHKAMDASLSAWNLQKVHQPGSPASCICLQPQLSFFVSDNTSKYDSHHYNFIIDNTLKPHTMCHQVIQVFECGHNYGSKKVPCSKPSDCGEEVFLRQELEDMKGLCATCQKAQDSRQERGQSEPKDDEGYWS